MSCVGIPKRAAWTAVITAPPPMVEVPSDRNYLSMALEELAEGKLKYEYRA